MDLSPGIYIPKTLPSLAFLGRLSVNPSTETNLSQVRVKAYLLSRLGPIVRIEFSPERSQSKINWLQSRRLMPGKLVALTTKQDGFRNICKLATIAQRPYLDGLDQAPPQVDLMWADVTDAVIDPTTELVMV